MGIRILTILQKSCNSKSQQQSFSIPGIQDRSQQGPDFDRLVDIYKREISIELKKQIVDEAPLQMKEFLFKGWFSENLFDG